MSASCCNLVSVLQALEPVGSVSKELRAERITPRQSQLAIAAGKASDSLVKAASVGISKLSHLLGTKRTASTS